MSTTELFSNLKCARCGTKDAEISEYKRRGFIPTCENCQKKFKIWKNGTRLAILLVVLSSIAIGITLTLLYPLSFMEKFDINYDVNQEIDSNYLRVLGWFQIALSFAIIFLACTVLLYILRRVYGSNPNSYFREENGPIIKSDIDTEWLSYREWINQTLLERGISENTTLDLIEAEIERQKTMKKKNTKTGRFLVSFGICFIIFGLISLIYGYYVSLVLTDYAVHGAYIFTVIHLPPAAIFLLFGFIDFILGKKKKKFYNLV